MIAKPSRSTSDASKDRQVLQLSLACFVIGALTQLVCLATGTASNIPVCLILLLFCMATTLVRGDLRDPLLTLGLGLFVYSFTPELGDASRNRFIRSFGTDGALQIKAWVVLTYFAAVGFAILILPAKSISHAAEQGEQLKTARLAGLLGGTASTVLGLLYIASRGAVGLGDLSYAEGFASRLEMGTGVLLLSVPLAIASQSFVMITEGRFFTARTLLTTIPYLLLFVGTGSRRYILIPVLLFLLYYARIKNLFSFLFMVLIASSGWIIFNYLGYMRINSIPMHRFIDASVICSFVSGLPEHAIGEAPILFATASAAYNQFITPLPWAGDYTLAWLMSVPQWLGGTLFSPVNVRFSFAMNPSAALLGQGWGFDFWGEAYLVGGWLVVTAACMLIAIFFRFLFVRSGFGRGTALPVAIYIPSLYYAWWFQRNAFAYLLKEYLIYQIAILTLLWALASVAVRWFGPVGDAHPRERPEGVED